MLKRKFGLKSLFNGLSSKGPRGTYHDDGLQDFISDTESEEHFDPSAVNRPPPLDSRTEALLREACTIIVQNLKPSGYDIEDTRMKSDILVDDLSDQDEPPVTALPVRKEQRKSSIAPSTWYKEESDRTSKVSPTYEAHAGSDKGRSGPTAEDVATIHAKRKSDHLRISKALREEYPTPEVVVLQSEGPIAPLPSVRRQSRNDVVPRPPQIPDRRSMPAERHGSSSTMSTQYAKSTNDAPSVATNGTSVTHTPASNMASKRTSEQTSRDQQMPKGIMTTTAAAAGAWMEEEVEKRRQAETVATPATIATPSEAEEQYHQAQAVPLVYSRASSLRSESYDPFRAPRPSSRLDPTPTIHDDSHTIPKYTTADPVRSSQNTAPAAVAVPLNTMQGQQEYAQTQKGLGTPDPLRIANTTEPLDEDSQRTPLVKPTTSTTAATRSLFATDSFDTTLAHIRARMAATSLSSHPIAQAASSSARNQTVVNDMSSQPASEDVETKDVARNNFPKGRRSSGPSWPVPPRLSSTLSSSDRAAQQSSINSQQQQESGVFVKDFWQAAGNDQSQRARLMAARLEKARFGNDIDPVSFDAFMSVVEHANTGTGRRPQSLSSSQSRHESKSSTSKRLPNGPRDLVGKHAEHDPELIDDLTSPSTTSRTFSLASSDAKSPALPPLPETATRTHPSYSHHQQYASSSHGRSSSSARPSMSSPFTTQTKPQAYDQSRQPSLQQQQQRQPQHPQAYPSQDFFRQEQLDPEVLKQISSKSNSNLPANVEPYRPVSRPPIPQVPVPPQSVKSPSRLSISSRAPSMHTNVSAPSAKPSSSGIKRWLGRRKSFSLLPNSNRTTNGYGYTPPEQYQVINGYGGMYGDEEFDDPLVCAAPVVAFGRGW